MSECLSETQAGVWSGEGKLGDISAGKIVLMKGGVESVIETTVEKVCRHGD